MTSLVNTIFRSISSLDPLTLAILFIGLISIGVIWLASLAIKALIRGKKT